MATPLKVGESRTVEVRSEQYWNDTGIMLEPGRYRFEAGGRWTDWFVATGPEGYDSLALLFFERGRRLPRARWFTLGGAIGRDEAGAFAIGAGTERDVAEAGELCCFANDLPAMYWNNRGAVSLTVTCLSLAAAQTATPAAAPQPEPAPAPEAKAEPAEPAPKAAEPAPAPKAAEPAPKAAPKPKAKPKAKPKTAEAAPKAPRKRAPARKAASGSDAAPGTATKAPGAKPRKPRARSPKPSPGAPE